MEIVEVRWEGLYKGVDEGTKYGLEQLHQYSDQAPVSITEGQCFVSQEGQEISVFSKTSRPALGPAQSCVQWEKMVIPRRKEAGN